jgi:hypothetical protein
MAEVEQSTLEELIFDEKGRLLKKKGGEQVRAFAVGSPVSIITEAVETERPVETVRNEIEFYRRDGKGLSYYVVGDWRIVNQKVRHDSYWRETIRFHNLVWPVQFYQLG